MRLELATTAMAWCEHRSNPSCDVDIAFDEFDVQLADFFVHPTRRIGALEEWVNRDFLPLRALNQDARLCELSCVHAMVPVKVGLDQGVDVVERKTLFIELLLERFNIDDVLEDLPGEMQWTGVPADVFAIVGGAATCVDEHNRTLTFDQP
jgi:hypothetical protein